MRDLACSTAPKRSPESCKRFNGSSMGWAGSPKVEEWDGPDVDVEGVAEVDRRSAALSAASSLRVCRANSLSNARMTLSSRGGT